MKRWGVGAVCLTLMASAAAEPLPSPDALEAGWRARVQSFLERGVIPIIDLESSLRREDGEHYLADTLPVMDDLGVALIAFDAYQAKKTKKKGQ